MTRFAANLTMMFNETGFLDRFSRAASAGFRGVEYLFPYEFEASAIRSELNRNELTQALFNLPPGNWAAGERGLAALPGREKHFEESVALALAYARELGCERLHVMAGLRQPDIPDALQRQTFVHNLRYAARVFKPHGIQLLIEPINCYDMPGYYLSTPQQAQSLLEEVGCENMALQFDVYHCQIMTGNVMATMRRMWPLIGHIQIASVPDRHEPDEGEMNYPWLFRQLDVLGYGGWVGCEYRPRGNTEAGLGWLQQAVL